VDRRASEHVHHTPGPKIYRAGAFDRVHLVLMLGLYKYVCLVHAMFIVDANVYML
jgi:hypothetical protein